MCLKSLIALNVFDCVSTMMLVCNGIGEYNPLVKFAIAKMGLIGIPAIKSIPLAMIMIIGIKRQSKLTQMAIMFTCIIYAIVMIVINLPLLILVTFPF